MKTYKWFYWLICFVFLTCLPSFAGEIKTNPTTPTTTTKQKIEKKYKVTEIRDIIDKWIEYYGITKENDKIFVHTIARVESDYNPYAKDKYAPCYGLFQLNRIMGKTFNEELIRIRDFYNPDKNSKGGVGLIFYYLQVYPKMKYEEIAQVYNLGEPKYFKYKKRNAVYVKLFKDRWMREVEYRRKINIS